MIVQVTTGYKLVRFLLRLSIIFGVCSDCPPSLASFQGFHQWKLASFRDCPSDSASESPGQSPQEAFYHAQTRQGARDWGQSHQKLNQKLNQSRTVSAGSENWQISLYPVIPLKFLLTFSCSASVVVIILLCMWRTWNACCILKNCLIFVWKNTLVLCEYCLDCAVMLFAPVTQYCRTAINIVMAFLWQLDKVLP